MVVNPNYLLSLLVCAALGAASAGCSTLESFGWGKGGASTSKKEGAPAAAGGIYYAGAADLPLYRNPGGEIVARLPLHTKLYRDELKAGYAHVRIAPSGESGWVENARLIWRLPAQVEQPQPAEATKTPAVAPPVAPPASAPAPASTPGGTTQPTVGPSIFNPY